MFKTLRTVFQGVAMSGLLLMTLGASLDAPAQAPEGYDPLIQISHQFAHPNLYIVQDLSGSMAWDINGKGVGSGATGTDPVLTWSVVKSTCGTGVNLGKCKKYVYTLRNTQTYPSRMSTVKNALGTTTNIITPWEPPATWPALPAVWTAGTESGPVETHSGSAPWTHDYAWTVTYGTYQPDPGPPFVAFGAGGVPTLGSGAEHLAAQNLIGTTASVVNWGVVSFNDTSATRRVTVDSSDSGDATAVLTYINGMAAGSGSTPTRAGIQKGEDELQTAFLSDPKYMCDRTYALVLVTDGLSNNGNDSNPSDKNWINPCGSCPSTTCCDASGGSYNCPSGYTRFPAGKAEAAWTSTQTRSGVTLTRLRTWAIGIAPNVNQCEMNMDAYMGRTDASSPNNDAGFALDPVTKKPLDPRLPQSTGDTSRYNPGGGNYAYFAMTATALRDAFAAIVAAVAAGDYTTAAPVASSSVGTKLAILPSTEFPYWKGHLWAFDTDLVSGQPGYTKWDGGWNLRYSHLPADDTVAPWVEGTETNPAYVAPNNRLIYTWNRTTKALVRVNAANAATLNTLCGSCGIDAGVVDFILGYDGTQTNTIRPWVLASTINATPAIVQASDRFTQGTLESHEAFDAANGEDADGTSLRVPMVWVGSDDGQLHGFKMEDGQEVISLLPPNLLSKQVTLKANYHATKRPVGQPQMPVDHIYGLAGSPRYGDMYFAASNDYKTVMLVSQGPGGDMVAGIDVTDPIGKLIDVNPPTPGGTLPVSILWNNDGTTWPGLYKSWSTPAGGASKGYGGTSATHSIWTGITGWGYNSASKRATPLTPKALLFDPTTGALKATQPTSPANVGSPAPLVGNQTFADSVIYSTTADLFYPDNVVNLALQPDLNGRIWFMNVTNGANPAAATVGIDVTNKPWSSPYAANQQPIYYSCAVNSYEVPGQKYDAYVFGSGTTYEMSTYVTGKDVGKTGAGLANFIPSLYIVIKQQGTFTTQAAATEILRIPIQELYVPDDLTTCICADESAMCDDLRAKWGTWNQVFCKTSGMPSAKLGMRTQLSAPPMLLVPVGGVSGTPVALFLLYDPDAVGDCAGKSYILQVNFEASSAGAPTVKESLAYNAGSGAASGFAVSGGKVIIAKSHVGSGAQAGVSSVPGLDPTAGMGNPTPLWWRELK